MLTPASKTRAAHPQAGEVCLIATNAEYAKLCKQALRRLPASDRSRIQVVSPATVSDLAPSQTMATETIFISRLADLPAGGAKLSGHPGSKHVLFLEGLPVEAMTARLMQLNIRTPERLHLASQRSSEGVADLVYRLLSGITHHSGPEPMVDAWVEDVQLLLLAASFERLAVPLTKLAKSIGTNRREIESFEIDEDGSYLYWPHADAHLGWNQFRQIIDPTAALAAQQRSQAFNSKYGAAIRAVREEAGLKQSAIPGVTERHLRRVEHGEQAASKATLQSLADALNVSLNECLKRLASQMAT